MNYFEIFGRFICFCIGAAAFLFSYMGAFYEGEITNQIAKKPPFGVIVFIASLSAIGIFLIGVSIK